MSCAACSARVEKAVSAVEGVTSCSVSLLTNSMGVEGTASQSRIIEAVQQAGYGASPKGASDKGESAGNIQALEDSLKDRETPVLRRRLLSSIVFLLLLMYLSMGHMMWGWPLPSFLDGNHVAMGLAQLLLTVIIMVLNQKFFISGFTSLWHGAPNMDTLVALGSSAAFGYSTYALFAMTGAQVHGDADAVMGYMHEFYFESAAMILTLITVGKMLEAYSKGKTTNALKGLMNLAPKTAVLFVDGKEKEVPVELDWFEDTVLDKGFLLHCLPARHFSGRSLKANQALWASFLIETPSQKIYMGGDSGYDTHFAEIGKQYPGIDLAILENGQYNEDWKYIHTMPQYLGQVARDLNAEKLLTVHHSKYALARHRWDEPLKNAMNLKEKDSLNVLMPIIGEVVRLK